MVTITGSNFTQASNVMFNTTPAAAYTVVSPTDIMAISPAGSAGTVTVSVTTPVATSQASAADQFTYEAAPSLASGQPECRPAWRRERRRHHRCQLH